MPQIKCEKCGGDEIQTVERMLISYDLEWNEEANCYEYTGESDKHYDTAEPICCAEADCGCILVQCRSCNHEMWEDIEI